MVKFEAIHISNFRSIEEAELLFDAGVWHIIGKNLDDHASNGAGKTTITAAVQQALYNRTIYDTSIESVSRRVGNKIYPYEITLTFYVNDTYYKVINSRKSKSITIFEDGHNLQVKGIPQALKTIVDIVGMDYTSFVTMTTITSDNIASLIDNFSSSSLMKLILNFQALSEATKAFKSEEKYVRSEIQSMYDQMITMENTLKILNKFTKIDLTPLNKERIQLYDKIHNSGYVTQIESLNAALDALSANIISAEEKLSYYSSRLSDGICDCCGQEISITADERLTLTLEINRISADVERMREQYVEQQEDIQARIKEIEQQREIYTSQLAEIDARIAESKAKNQIYAESKPEVDRLSERLAEMITRREELVFRQQVCETAQDILKSGVIHKDLLDSFTYVLNANLDKFMNIVQIDYIKLHAESRKDSVQFVMFDTRFSNDPVELAALSGGERTRIRLIILLSMLDTVRSLTSYNTNLLVFDESLDSLDTAATEDLKKLFNYLITVDEKWIGLISHGQQLQDVHFTGDITAVKHNGKTKLEVTYDTSVG